MTRMPRLFLAGAMLFVILYSPGISTTRELTVGVLGDQTGTRDLAHSYRLLVKGVQTLRKEQVDLVLHVGDLLESTRQEGQIRADFNKAIDILSFLERPWYITPGDHDINPGDWITDSNDRGKETLFRELLATVLPQTADRLYYSIDHGGYHFVSLNSVEHLHTDPRWGNIFLARLSERQIAWLRSDLEQHRDAIGTSVFLHQPLWYNAAGWQPVHSLLREHGALAVLAGHFHYDQDDGMIDGIRYLVIGATGASVKNASSEAGNMHQVAVLQLHGRTMRYKLIDIESGRETRFTPRADADRVQALDYSLGSLHAFSTENRLFLKDDLLVNDCATGNPATLRMFALGNSIDLPVHLEIDLAPGSPFTLADHHFQHGLCSENRTVNQCTIPAGRGMAISNTSTASFCFPVCPDSSAPDNTAGQHLSVPVSTVRWSATVHPSAQRQPQPGESLRLRITLRFLGDQGDMSVLRDLVSAPLQQCRSSR